MNQLGYVHSQQTGSALDGPGLRTVFWLAGCELRCLYCHNPDTWKLRAGRPVSSDELAATALQYARFSRVASGGMTLSGGEPLVQHEFCKHVFSVVHAAGMHTALDTNGFLGDRLANEDLADIDLVLLDLKSWHPETHRRLTGASREPVLRFAERLAEQRRPVWIRFVLVPGVTDESSNVLGLARFCAQLGNVALVEVLPFHQLGRYKWRELGQAYSLEHTPPPSAQALAQARAAFAHHGLCTA